MSRINVVTPLLALLVSITTAVAKPGGPATSEGSASAASPATGHSVVVCVLSGQDLPRSGLRYLSELVRNEVDKTDLLALDDILPCKPDVASVAAAGRLANADRAISGRIATVGDLFVVELKLVDCRESLVLAEESVEVVGSVLDPRLLVRTATQRLIGVGGWTTLKNSYVNISSTPPGARVFVDDLLEGAAPMRIQVAPGRHGIKAILPGHAEWSMDVDVITGETLSLNAAPVSSMSGTQAKTDGGRVITGFAVPYAVTFGQGALYLAGVQSARPYLGLALVGAPLTYFLASDEVSRAEITVGQAYMIISSGLWGAAWGLMGAGVSALDEPRPYVAASMAASAAGILFSSGFAQQRELSRKRVSLINAGGFLGSAIGIGLPYLLDAQGTRVYMLGLLSGGVIGTVSAINLTAGLDFVGEQEPVASMSLVPRLAVVPAGSDGDGRSGLGFGGSLQLTF